ncbi:TonB-dependent receptor domain-containing protein [Dokdonella sp. MW10]|uniref:TonB-dependent receptor domain-containing protein n=1 Tax=Dokdonella sp. MW10 TaxID=2992926 RepID=UPI003F82172B
METFEAFVRRSMRRILIVLAMTASCADAAALDVQRNYDVPAGRLSDALNAWAITSKAQILYSPDLVASKSSLAIRGRHAASDALQILLRDSGLQAESTGAATWILRKAPSRRRAQSPVPRDDSSPRDEAAVSHVLETVSVYSRPLLRVASESSIPVITLTRQDIEASTHLSLFDLLRSLPGVQVTSHPVQGSGGTSESFGTRATGAASVALRNLGAKATLLLVDGRRMTNYGLAADGTGGVPDVDSIPLAMIERIDVLREGASTLYGADAIGGVIDISLRKDVAYREVGLVLGSSDEGDAEQRQVTAVLSGRTRHDVQALLMLDLVDREPLHGYRRGWHSQDRRRDGLPDARSYFSFPGNRVLEEDGNVTLVSRAGCAPRDLDEQNTCREDRAKSTSLGAERQSASIRTYISAPLGASTSTYLGMRVTATHQEQQSSPVSATLLLPTDDDVAASQLVRHSFWDVGPVRQATDASLIRLDGGIIGNTGTWEWDLGFDAERSAVRDRIHGLVNRFGFIEVSELGYRFDARPAPQEIAGILAPTILNRGSTRSAGVRAIASRSIDTWATSPASFHLGIDLRHDALDLSPDASLVSGDLIALEALSPIDDSRSSAALFARMDIPLSESIAADGGLRIEQVQEHGAVVAPALGLRWNPAQGVLLRAGAARGRRVPTLLEQRNLGNAGVTPTYGYFDLPHNAPPCAQHLNGAETRCLLELRPTDGPPLRAERSVNAHLGAIWEPRAGFSAGIDVYQARRRDEIGVLPAAYVVQNAGMFQDLLIRDGEGRLEGLRSFRVNFGDTLTRGVDADLQWSKPTRSHAVLSFVVGINHVFDYRTRVMPQAVAVERAGYADAPDWSAKTTLRWTTERWVLSADLRYRGSSSVALFEGERVACGSSSSSRWRCRNPASTLLNGHAAYTGVAGWRLSFGVSNLLNRQPRDYRPGSYGYNPLTDDPVGRYVTLGLARRF